MGALREENVFWCLDWTGKKAPKKDKCQKEKPLSQVGGSSRNMKCEEFWEIWSNFKDQQFKKRNNLNTACKKLVYKSNGADWITTSYKECEIIWMIYFLSVISLHADQVHEPELRYSARESGSMLKFRPSCRTHKIQKYVRKMGFSKGGLNVWNLIFKKK